MLKKAMTFESGWVSFILIIVIGGYAHGGAPTWNGEIRAIFEKSCRGCHQSGGTAPMSLRTWSESRPWAKSIRESVAKREMPPWHANAKPGEFRNDRRLSESELKTILDWVDAGAPEGFPSVATADDQALNVASSSDAAWKIGMPDHIFELPEETNVAAEWRDKYEYYSLVNPFPDERWIEAVEVQPGNPQVVHHILSTLVGSFEPGVEPLVMPEGTAVLLEPNTRVLLEIHYHNETGRAQKDRSRIGVRFARGTVRQRLYHDRFSADEIVLPPRAANVQIRAEKVFEQDALLRAMRPHMHLRGRSIKYTAFFPDGTSRLLLDVPQFDFNWQTRYELTKPVRLPRGTRLVAEAVYDNSADNPHNPNPNVEVRTGIATTDEMLNGHIDYTLMDEDISLGKRLKDPNHYGPEDIERLIQVDRTRKP